MTAEEEVRAAWELTTKCDGSYRHYQRGTVLIQEVHGQWKDFESWQSALDYTRQRQQEIAEIEEEISAVHDLYGYDHNCLGYVWERILTRLQAQLTGLKKGMKGAQ